MSDDSWEPRSRDEFFDTFSGYGELIEESRINEIAEQMVAGIVESLLSRQPNLDSVTYRSTIGDPPLW